MAKRGGWGSLLPGNKETDSRLFSDGKGWLLMRRPLSLHQKPALPGEEAQLSLGDPGLAPLGPFLRWAPHGKAGEGPNTRQSNVRPGDK